MADGKDLLGCSAHRWRYLGEATAMLWVIALRKSYAYVTDR